MRPRKRTPGGAGLPPTSEQPDPQPQPFLIRRLDIVFARAKGLECTDFRRAKYRYVKSPDIRDDELGYGDRLEMRYLTVNGVTVELQKEVLIRARSGRILAHPPEGVPRAVTGKTAEYSSEEATKAGRRTR